MTALAHVHGVRWWPSALGAGVAIATGLGAGLLHGVGGGLAAIVMVCAAIYLLAAVTGRPNSAWIGFAASLPLVGIGLVLHDPLISLGLIGVGSVVLVVVGAVKRTWRSARSRRQLYPIVAFTALALSAALLWRQVVLAAVIVIVGLLLHAAWDVWHHTRNETVARPYAEFCAVLDVVLAVVAGVLVAIG